MVTFQSNMIGENARRSGAPAVTRAIALLRAVNVGGAGKLPMAELAKLLTKLGYTEVKTIVQSGNAVFTCAVKADAKLEASLEAALSERVRFANHDLRAQRRRVGRDHRRQSVSGHGRKRPEPSRGDDVQVRAHRRKRESAASRDSSAAKPSTRPAKQLYLTYPDGIGDSKLSNTIIERKLAVAGTARELEHGAQTRRRSVAELGRDGERGFAGEFFARGQHAQSE